MQGLENDKGLSQLLCPTCGPFEAEVPPISPESGHPIQNELAAGV